MRLSANPLPAREPAHCRLRRTGYPAPALAARRKARAFTLVELLLVMALLAVVLAVAAPSLGGFFRGRTLDSEGRRILALTHAAQSRAVSEGIPMSLWVDAEERTYGLRQQAGWDEQDRKAVDFTLGQDLHVEVVNTNQPTRPQMNRLGGANPQNTLNRPMDDTQRDLPEIRFLPDGSIAETSLSALRLSDKDGVSLWLTRSRNRLHYEIRNP